MKLSREARRQARELFEMTLVNGRIDAPRLRMIFSEVADRQPRSHIQILKEILRLARLEAANHHAVIESATPLTDTASLAADLLSRFGELTIEFRETPALIGGLRIQIGSKVWDGSIRARLESIKSPR